LKRRIIYKNARNEKLQNTLTILNIYCFSTATMVTRTRFNVTV